jgi:hypothetical protein
MPQDLNYETPQREAAVAARRRGWRFISNGLLLVILGGPTILFVMILIGGVLASWSRESGAGIWAWFIGFALTAGCFLTGLGMTVSGITIVWQNRCRRNR